MNSAFGFLQSGLAPCSSAEEHPKLFDACLYFVANGFHRYSIVGVELSNGAPRLNARNMCESSLLWWWEARTPTRNNYIELERAHGTSPDINISKLCPGMWKSVRCIRTLEAIDTSAYEAPHPAQQEADLIHDDHPPNTLSPIPEESSADLSVSTDSLICVHDDPEL